MAYIWRNLDKNKELLREAARSKAFIIFDTETTGLSATDDIIELAAQKCAFHNGEFQVYDELHEYIKPYKMVPKKVSEINHLTNEFLADKPDARQIFPKIKAFMGDAPVVGAYNSGFDVKKMEYLYQKNNDTFQPKLEIDLLKIAKDVFCEQKLRDHKLGTIAETYGVDEGIEFHTAIDDVRVLIRVMNAMIKDMEENGVSRRLRPVRVYKLNYWPMFRGNGRLYVITSCGPFFYDFLNDMWKPNDPDMDTSTIDMAGMERQMFELAECSTYPELIKKCKSGAFDQKKPEAV